MVAHYLEAALRVALRTAPPRRRRRARRGDQPSRHATESSNPARLLLEHLAPGDPEPVPNPS
jgi:hypothetical protein